MKKILFLIVLLVLLVLACNSPFGNNTNRLKYTAAVTTGKDNKPERVKQVYYTLTINVLGSGSVSVNGENYIEEILFLKDSAVRVVAIAGEGYEFKEWIGSIESTNPVIEGIVMTDNITLLASFIIPQSPIEYKYLVLNVGKNGAVKINGILHENTTDKTITITREYEIDTELTLEAIPNAVSLFGGWSGSGITGSDINPIIKIVLNDTKTLSASFSLNEKELHIAPSLYGYALVSINGGEYFEYTDIIDVVVNDKVKVKAIANDTRTHEFAKWSGSSDSTSSEIIIESVSANISLTPEFKKTIKTLTININDSSKGSIKVNGLDYTGPVSVFVDTEVTIIAAREVGNGYSGYAFEKYSGDYNSTQRKITLTMDHNKTLNASFINAFDIYNNKDRNGYDASRFNTWVLVVPDFGSDEIPAYNFNYTKTWSAPANVTIYSSNGVVPQKISAIAESKFSGVNSKAAGMAIKTMVYFMYKGNNYYITRDKGNADHYNSAEHLKMLERFYFYRFTGDARVLGIGPLLNNSLCAVDTYTKLIYAYAVPTKFGSSVGQTYPTLWEAIEEKDAYSDMKFYEYDPIGFVDGNGNVTLFETFKNIQKGAKGQGQMNLYLPKHPDINNGSLELDITKLNNTSVIRSPYY